MAEDVDPRGSILGGTGIVIPFGCFSSTFFRLGCFCSSNSLEAAEVDLPRSWVSGGQVFG